MNFLIKFFKIFISRLKWNKKGFERFNFLKTALKTDFPCQYFLTFGGLNLNRTISK